MKSSGCIPLLAGALIATSASAQSNIDISSAVKIEAKVTPYRVFWMFPPSGNDVEVNFYLSDHAADFTAVLFECSFLGKERQKTGDAFTGLVARTQFKQMPDGRLIAQQKRERLPGADRTGAECRILDVRK